MKLTSLKLNAVVTAVAAVAALVLSSSNATAVQRPVERTIQGVVESVNAKSQLISLKTEGKAAKRMVIAWKGQTHFQDAAGKHATSDILKPGMTVMVKYRSVLAGASQASSIDAR